MIVYPNLLTTTPLYSTNSKGPPIPGPHGVWSWD